MNSKKKHAWYIEKNGFWRRITEKVLQKKWLRMPSYAMDYFGKLDEKEREKLLDQWGKEVKDYINELKPKGLIY